MPRLDELPPLLRVICCEAYQRLENNVTVPCYCIEENLIYVKKEVGKGIYQPIR